MQLLFRDDAYIRSTEAVVTAVSDSGVTLDRTVFYPTGGGQPGDTGVIRWASGETRIVDTRKGETHDAVVHIPEAGAALPPVGATVELELDWDRRHRHMRMHSCMHLLCAVVPGAVTGGQVGAERSRLDFDVPSGSLDKEEIEAALNRLIEADHPVRELRITDEELAERPELVRTMSVKPPTGSGTVRLLQIGPSDCVVDLQPCGGTHIRHTGEIGPVEVVKIENKGKQNRRVVIALKD
ncbi:MAG TPA: alanyl-tRNA editing protein [Azospirillaceae bacterium]|nr:alanyl-tRNA editing protein [Azospirillaceae bacterium]